MQRDLAALTVILLLGAFSSVQAHGSGRHVMGTVSAACYAASNGESSARLTGLWPTSRRRRLIADSERSEGAVISMPMARPARV